MNYLKTASTARHSFRFKVVKTAFSILLGAAAFFTLSAKETVKVGYYPMQQFNKFDKNGNPYGYNVEYLDKISEYTDWHYEFVIYDSWEEALQGLENNEIDMLAPAQKTAERAKKFLFAGFPIGREYGAVLTLNTNENLIFEDFDQFNKITFGCVGTSLFKNEFLIYAHHNGFSPIIKNYNDTNTLISALNKGEVDAAVVNLMMMRSNMKILAKTGAAPYYYMFTNDNFEKQRKMDDALQLIQINFPMFENQLEEKYMISYKISPYSKKEIDFVSTLPVLNVGCITNADPISYIDRTTGTVKGIAHDTLELISVNTGIKFNYVPVAPTDATHDYLNKNSISILSSVEHNIDNFISQDIQFSTPYFYSQKVIVCRPGETFDRSTEKVMGISNYPQSLQSVLAEKYPEFKFIKFDSTEEGLNAVKKRKTDYFIQNQYVIDRLLARPKYEHLKIVKNEGLEDILCLSVIQNQQTPELTEKLSDPRLISIINKGLFSIAKDTKDRIIISNTSERMYKYTKGEIIFKYRVAISITLIIAVFLIFSTLFAIFMRRKNMEIIIKSERQLKNITNNINGGVVLLLPDQGFKIQYANEGFFKLLQYDKKEFCDKSLPDYITLVHPDDISKLNRVIESKKSHGSQISIELRIKRQDGKYIDTLFNGTVSENRENRKILYCVITDISAQKRMIEQLEIQQEQYEVVINRSQDIIFDIDIINSKTTVSSKFQEQFGWNLPEKFVRTKIAEQWHIYTQDMKLFKTKINTAVESTDIEDDEFNVRIQNSGNSEIWCNISIHQIRKNGKTVRLIGKIQNIDKEMKEREDIEEKAGRDNLTDLYRKETFYSVVKKYLNEESNITGALIFLDLDNFKSVNDKLGHIRGDSAIIDASKKLQIIFSNYDIIGRFGGDEFCVFVKNIPQQTLISKLEWTNEKMQQDYTDGTNRVRTSASIGVALVPEHGKTLEILLACADKALYDAKAKGKNRFSIYSTEMDIQ